MHTRPWSDDPLRTLENKYQIAIDLAYCCEKVVYQLAIIWDTLPEVIAEISDPGAVTVREANSVIRDVVQQMLPGSLLYDSLVWFREHTSTDKEKRTWESIVRIANSPCSASQNDIAMLVMDMKPLANLLARFRDELKLTVSHREAGTSPNELRFHEVEKGVMLYGVFVPVTKLKRVLLKKFHDIERECTFQTIASWHSTWKDKYENKEVEAAERDIAKRIGELSQTLRVAFHLDRSSMPIQKRTPNEQTLWQLDLPMLKVAALKVPATPRQAPRFLAAVYTSIRASDVLVFQLLWSLCVR
jgi:hypothetical protein